MHSRAEVSFRTVADTFSVGSVSSSTTKLKTNARVVVRAAPCRPGEHTAVVFSPGSVYLYDEPLGGYRKYDFDGVYDSSAPQDLLYDVSVRGIVEDLLRGIHGTIFAYGPTNSGKSFTIQGPSRTTFETSASEHGILQRSLHQLLEASDNMGGALSISVSAFEIQNDVIKDLLSPGSFDLKLLNSVRQTLPSCGVPIQDLSCVAIQSPVDIAELLTRAKTVRSLASSSRIDRGSRCHKVFSIVVQHRRATTPGEASDESRLSILNIVDCAASDKAREDDSASATEKQRLARAFGALTNIIITLGRPGGLSPLSHIPYRDSKLTHSLKESLVPGSNVLLIANIPSEKSKFLDIFATLKFAERIQSSVQGLMLNDDDHSHITASTHSSPSRPLQSSSRSASPHAYVGPSTPSASRKSEPRTPLLTSNTSRASSPALSDHHPHTFPDSARSPTPPRGDPWRSKSPPPALTPQNNVDTEPKSLAQSRRVSPTLERIGAHLENISAGATSLHAVADSSMRSKAERVQQSVNMAMHGLDAVEHVLQSSQEERALEASQGLKTGLAEIRKVLNKDSNAQAALKVSVQLQSGSTKPIASDASLPLFENYRMMYRELIQSQQLSLQLENELARPHVDEALQLFNAQVAHLEEEKNAAQRLAEEGQRNLGTLQSQLESLQEDMRLYERKCVQVQGELDAAKQRLSAEESRRKSLESQLESDLARLHTQLAHKDALLADMHHHVHSNAALRAELQAAASRAQQQGQEMQQLGKILDFVRYRASELLYQKGVKWSQYRSFHKWKTHGASRRRWMLNVEARLRTRHLAWSFLAWRQANDVRQAQVAVADRFCAVQLKRRSRRLIVAWFQNTLLVFAGTTTDAPASPKSLMVRGGHLRQRRDDRQLRVCLGVWFAWARRRRHLAHTCTTWTSIKRRRAARRCVGALFRYAQRRRQNRRQLHNLRRRRSLQHTAAAWHTWHRLFLHVRMQLLSSLQICDSRTKCRQSLVLYAWRRWLWHHHALMHWIGVARRKSLHMLLRFAFRSLHLHLSLATQAKKNANALWMRTQRQHQRGIVLHWQCWTQSRCRLRQQQVDARRHAAYVFARRCLVAWSSVCCTHRVAVQALADQLDRKAMKGTFSAWKAFNRAIVGGRKAATRFNHRQHSRRLRFLLSHWRLELARAKHTEVSAMEFRRRFARHRARGALRCWYWLSREARQRRAAWRTCADRFRASRLLSLPFHAWLRCCSTSLRKRVADAQALLVSRAAEASGAIQNKDEDLQGREMEWLRERDTWQRSMRTTLERLAYAKEVLAQRSVRQSGRMECLRHLLVWRRHWLLARARRQLRQCVHIHSQRRVREVAFISWRLETSVAVKQGLAVQLLRLEREVAKVAERAKDFESQLMYEASAKSVIEEKSSLAEMRQRGLLAYIDTLRVAHAKAVSHWRKKNVLASAFTAWRFSCTTRSAYKSKVVDVFHASQKKQLCLLCFSCWAIAAVKSRKEDAVHALQSANVKLKELEDTRRRSELSSRLASQYIASIQQTISDIRPSNQVAAVLPIDYEAVENDPMAAAG